MEDLMSAADSIYPLFDAKDHFYEMEDSLTK